MLSIKLIFLLMTIVSSAFDVIYSKENTWDEDVKIIVKRGVLSEVPHEIGQVLDDATHVFGNVVGKILAKKRLLGFDVNKWYW